MNSIEIAKKLIEENDSVIEGFRREELCILKRIAKYENDIDEFNKLIEAKKRTLTIARENLSRTRNRMKAYLVDNQALKMFIANGGGLDMLD